MAPERFSRDNTPIMANDVYSLGATAYEMLTGDAPFGDDGGLMQMKGAQVPRLKGKFSKDLQRTIEACLATNPWERPTAAQLEKYAADAMAGKAVVFAKAKKGGPVDWKKWGIAAAVAAVLAAGVAAAVAIKGSADRQAEAIAQSLAKEKAHADSLQAAADSLAKVKAKAEAAADTAAAAATAAEQAAELAKAEKAEARKAAKNSRHAKREREEVEVKREPAIAKSEETKPAAGKLVLSSRYVPLKGAGEPAVTVAVSGASDWTIASQPDWCRCEKRADAVVVKAKRNRNSEVRTGKIVISGGGHSATITVEQERLKFLGIKL